MSNSWHSYLPMIKIVLPLLLLAVSCAPARPTLVCRGGQCMSPETCIPQMCLPDQHWSEEFCLCEQNDDAHLEK